MALRCRNCAKLAPINNETEPESDNDELDVETGKFTANVCITNNCADCDDALSQHMFDVELDFMPIMKDHDCPEAKTGVGWTAEITEMRRSIRMHPPNRKVQVKFQTVEVDVQLKCNCGEVDDSLTWAGEVKTSTMEEIG